MLSIEVDATDARRLTGRLRFACLPILGDGYERTAHRPGVDKTHLLDGLARSAARVGYRTYFTTAADLAARCRQAALEGRWAAILRFYARPTLLVIDELGYLPLPGKAVSALLQVVSQRYEDFDLHDDQPWCPVSWGEVSGDNTVAAAMLDQLLHRSGAPNLDGDSYRIRDHTRDHRSSAKPPPELSPPQYSEDRSRLGNFSERGWGISLSLVNYSSTLKIQG